MTDGDPQERREVYYSGRVQGVGFRYTTQHLASEYPVGGYVKNLRDGRVELVVEGSPGAISALLEAIDQALGRHIYDCRQTSLPATGEFRGFEIRF